MDKNCCCHIKGELQSQGTLSGGLSVPESREGTSDYNKLRNKPTINQVTVEGDKVAKDYRLQDELGIVSDQDIDQIIYG